jgi:protein FAM32A
MAPSSDYASTPSTGKLKLKGVKDSKVDKKKSKKKKPRPEDEGGSGNEDAGFKDNSVVLKSLEDEDAVMTKEKHRHMGMVDGKEVAPGAGVEDEELGERIKTEAEKRYDEQRRRRVRFRVLTRACSWVSLCANFEILQLEERLKREGVKSHKQRVEELNRYLSGLSEHHDMPRIGPG